jgi:hypothetical protein
MAPDPGQARCLAQRIAGLPDRSVRGCSAEARLTTKDATCRSRNAAAPGLSAQEETQGDHPAEPIPVAGNRLRPAAPWNLPVTARTLQGMAPYPGQARCLALGFWPECFRRLDVKGGRRPFPVETRSALDIEGKHVTIQGPSPDLPSSVLDLPGPQVGGLRLRHRGRSCGLRWFGVW